MIELGARFLLAALVIAGAGTALARSADRIADRTGYGRLLVGSVLLAVATSLPEMLVDWSAVRLGEADLAVGDLMGSNLMNLLILAMADLSHNSRGRLLGKEAAAHALSATASITLVALAGGAILARLDIGVGGLGFDSVAIAVAYLLTLRLVYFDQMLATARARPETRARWSNVRYEIFVYLIAAGVLALAAPTLARSAQEIAHRSGLGTTFVGSTLVAASTSLPEFVATVAAVRIGALDLAAGNIFGSNAFNVVILVVLDFAAPGHLLSTVSTTHALSAFFVIMVTAVVVLGQLYHVERRRFPLEPDALGVIALTVIAYAVIYLRG